MPKKISIELTADELALIIDSLDFVVEDLGTQAGAEKALSDKLEEYWKLFEE